MGVCGLCCMSLKDISRGHRQLRQLGGFFGVGATVAPFVSTECPVEGGMWGIFGKSLKRAIRNTQLCMVYYRGVRDFRPFWTMPVLLAASFCQQAATMSSYKFTPHAVASPDAPQKPLVRKRARSGGASWVRVTHRTSPSNAKRPRTAGSHRLTKQRNVDLTTDGLWAMPLNTGWVPVKARRLQDWGKLKKYVPIQQAGGCVPQ